MNLASFLLFQMVLVVLGINNLIVFAAVVSDLISLVNVLFCLAGCSVLLCSLGWQPQFNVFCNSLKKRKKETVDVWLLLYELKLVVCTPETGAGFYSY